MATTVRVGNKGERLVAGWLVSRGYTVEFNAKTLGSTDVEARGPKNSMLVQVKTAVFPESSSPLSADEEWSLKARAQRLGLESWEARVQLNDQLQQVGDIKWRKLT